MGPHDAAIDSWVEPALTPLSTLHTVEEAIQTLRTRQFANEVRYFYVTDEQGALRGVVSTRQLILSDPAVQLASIMQEPVVHIRLGQTLKEAVSLFEQNPLLAFPVVCGEGKLQGIVRAEALLGEKLDPLDARSRYEMFQLIGMSVEDAKLLSLRQRYKARMPWLLCNVFSGLVCAMVSTRFEEVLSRYLLLAFFIPLVLTLSESASMQSMTQVLQFLRRPRFSWKVAIRRGKREWLLSGAIALSCGLLVGLLSLLWGDGAGASLMIGLGIALSVPISAFFGMIMPVFFSRRSLDPKVASGPVVLMIADIVTTALYLSLAAWWLL